MLDDLPRDARELFIDALVTYADACTRPLLTPSCPFYRASDEGPTCGEECRSIAESVGVISRPVGTAVIEGGLVLKGRQLPLATAGGTQDFDAQRAYILERERPLREQSTTTLFIGLAAALRPKLSGGGELAEDRVLALWQELEHRSVPVDDVVRGAVLPQVAVRIAERAMVTHAARSRQLPATASVALQRELADVAPGSWTTLLDALLEAVGPPVRDRSVLQSPYRRLAPGGVGARGLVSEHSEAVEIPVDDHIVLAFSSAFIGRIEEWLCRLLEEDLLSALRATPPPVAVFLALDTKRVIRDESGLWLWERLAVTDLAEWTDSSLLLEWRHLRGEYRGACPDRVLAERVIPRDLLAERALDRLSRRRGGRTATPDLHPVYFVKQAAEHLVAGRWEDAASIFRGLVEIRPADGEAWNNLGFCELHGEPGRAYTTLEQASLFELDRPLVNVVNRCLALHLLGRDDEAVALAESTSYLREEDRDGSAYLWVHSSASEPLSLVDGADPTEHLDALVDHIRNSACS